MLCMGKTENTFLPKAVSWKRWGFPCLWIELQLENFLCSAKMPCHLLMIQQSGAYPWRESSGSRCGKNQGLHIRVDIPVCCQIMDAYEMLYCPATLATVEANLWPSFALSESRKYQRLILPCVRLLCVECAGEYQRLRAHMEAQMEIGLLRPKIYMTRRSKSSCLDLPLYPQQCRSQGEWDWQTRWPKRG